MRDVEFQEYATIGVDLERRSQEDSIGMMRRMSVFVSKSGHVNYGSQCPKMALSCRAESSAGRLQCGQRE